MADPPRCPCSESALNANRGASGLTSPLQPDWTCGVCGRVWRDMRSGGVQWWAEIQGTGSHD